MIGNAHLDPAWMWEWGEGMEAFIATCRSALDRMSETPGFIFTCSSAAHYAWIEKVDPDLFQEIRDRVAEGRWEVVGGWWTQADCNLPSGEGFVRQALLGQRYFLETFGCAATAGYSPDAFGHNAGLPALLAGAGLAFYIFCRPDPEELALPAPLFRWRSPDGSSVLSYRVPFHYNMYQTTVPKKVTDLVEAFSDPKTELTRDDAALKEFGNAWGLFYGVGNHGGGPTKEQIGQIREIADAAEGPEIDFSRLDTYLKEAAESSGDRIPEWRDDLQLNAPGCYSVHTGMKSLNRKAEHLLIRAETFATLDAVLSDDPKRYPGGELQRAWENVAFNHFHDILCGVAIPEALEHATHLYGESLAVADRTLRYAIRRIVRRIDTTGDGQTLIVFNPHGHAVGSYVTVELWHDIDKELWSQPVDLRLTDDAGVELPIGSVYTSGKIGKDRVGGTFRAEVPALGWRCYRVHYGERSAYAGREGLVEATDTILENRWMRVEFSPETGGIVSLQESLFGTEFIDGEGAAGLVIRDTTDTWGHGVDRFDDVIGRFGEAEVKLVHSGPTHGTIRVTSRWNESWIRQDFTLYADSEFISVEARIFWSEPEAMLKLSFPTTLEAPDTIVEGAYTSVTKPCDGTERPGGSWKSIVGEIEGRLAGLGIADTLTHGYSALDSELRLSVLRCVSHATHDPHEIGPDEDVRYIDQGMTEFRYSIRPFILDTFRTRLAEDAALINAPLILSLESGHTAGPDELPREWSGIAISAPNIRVGAMKRSEEHDDPVIRLFETEGKETSVRIDMREPEASWEMSFRPHQVRTILIRDGHVHEVDLVERMV